MISAFNRVFKHILQQKVVASKPKMTYNIFCISLYILAARSIAFSIRPFFNLFSLIEVSKSYKNDYNDSDIHVEVSIEFLILQLQNLNHSQ